VDRIPVTIADAEPELKVMMSPAYSFLMGTSSTAAPFSRVRIG
jgi:hypothetical protein